MKNARAPSIKILLVTLALVVAASAALAQVEQARVRVDGMT